MHSTQQGNILLGFNNNPEILIFSPSGKKIHSFNLKLTRQKITSELKHRMYNVRIMRALKNPYMPKRYREGYQKDLIRDKNKILSEYPEYFNYYDDLYIDSDDNILVLKNRYIDEPDMKWTPIYQFYSTGGDLKGEFTLDFGEFDVRTRFHKTVFKGFLYGIFEKQTEYDDILFTLEKMTLIPKRRNNK